MPFELQAETAANILSRNRLAASTWNAGGARYDRISRQIADAIEHSVDRLNPRQGESILDIATGTGWTARQLRSRGADVTGIDFSPEMIEAARRLDSTQSIDFRVADAEALPFGDRSFDAVVSTFGVMFCSDPAQAAAELARVCRPGGRLALAVWDRQGGVYDLFQVISRHKPGQSASATTPFDWSDVERATHWLGDFFDLQFEKAVSYHREKHAEDAWKAFSTGYGPVKSLLQALDERSQAAFREDFVEFHQGYQTDVGILVPRPYVFISGLRRA